MHFIGPCVTVFGSERFTKESEHYKHAEKIGAELAYYKKKIASISNNKARVTFAGLPEGQYAATILHDENNNEKIDKKFMLPLPSEGVGFSNYDDFGLNNRPNFKKVSFNIVKDTSITIKAIYK